MIAPHLQAKRHSGQTLIETLVAVFMLVMGITAALGLAIYALNSSTGVTKQIIATGLAREGIEAVKDMRDTNWLQEDTLDTGCYDYVTQSNTPGSSCYKDWLGDSTNNVAPFCLNPTGNNGNCNGGNTSSSYYLVMDGTQGSMDAKNNKSFWQLQADNGSGDFGLNLNTSSATTTGFYYSPTGGVTCANAGSEYCRKIILTLDFTAPYNHPAGPTYNRSDIGPMVKIQSQVWWVDKKCPRVSDYTFASSGCRLELDSYLTNWKNYHP